MMHPSLESVEPRLTKKPRLTMEKARINLDDNEEKLRDFLVNVSNYVNEEKNPQDNLILRFAGGWVRDKLLGIPSNDIDVAINTMTGSSFTQNILKYIGDENNLKRNDSDELGIGRCYVTSANPEKSKHLETSTMTIMGYDIDFVNLRKETYSKESRNPQMEFGSPEEDALRRDCTINSLFYNIHTKEVEDFAGGLNDLKKKRIMTPLDPKTTFLDDPLRILRLIRFANRFNFTLDPSCESCMNNLEIIDAFYRKISRERVQVEVYKMLRGNNPHGALQLIDTLGLYDVIFTNVSPEDVANPDLTNWRRAYDCLQELMSNTSLSHTLLQSNLETAWLLAAYTPWSMVQENSSYTGKSKLPRGADAARVALKADNKKVNLISCSLNNFQDIINLKSSIIQGEAWTNQRDLVGNLIRKWDLQGNWRLQILFAILAESMGREKFLQDGNKYSTQKILSMWEKFLNHLETMDIMNASSIKNILDGKTLTKALGVKPGKWVREVLDFTMKWTLQNPGVNDTTELIEEIKKRREELGVPY